MTRAKDCIYCGVDCQDPDPEHAPDCPSSTGLYPVTTRDLVRLTRDGELHECGMVCSDCKTPFAVGDHYTHRSLGEVEVLGTRAEGCEVICLGCAVLDEATLP